MDLYSFPPMPPNWDAVGRFYVAFCATWTTLLLAGMGFLVANRRNPIIRVRGIGLSLTSICFLHCYWILAQVVYPIGQSLPVILAYDIQYFFMGLWFPLGIALFHASNTRFLHVAELQKQFTLARYQRRYHGCNGASTSWLCRLRCMEYQTRILVYIFLGMIVQVLLTVGMWFACKKYHPTFGIPGTELHGSNIMEQLVDLGRGWEWWPSVLWQFIWTWMVCSFPTPSLMVYRLSMDLFPSRCCRYMHLCAVADTICRWLPTSSGRPGEFVILWAGECRPLDAACQSKDSFRLGGPRTVPRGFYPCASYTGWLADLLLF